MSSSTRAFFIAALIALPCGALLHLLALIGVSGAWPAMVHMALFGWITGMIYAVNFHTMPVFTARDFPYPRLIWTQWLAWCAGVVLATTGILMPWRGAEIAGLLLQLLAALAFIIYHQHNFALPARPASSASAAYAADPRSGQGRSPWYGGH
jgi:hypothetical protein